MEAVCKSESCRASKALELVLMSMAEYVAVEAVLTAGKSLSWLLFVMSSVSGERSELGEPVKGSPLFSHGKKCTSVPENKDDGDSEDDSDDEEGDDDGFDPAEDGEEKEFTGDEGIEEDGDDGDAHEANGEGGSDEDDEDDEEDEEDEEDEDDEDEDDDDDEEEDQPPSKKRK